MPAVFRHQDWACRPQGAARRRNDRVVHCGIPFGTSTGVHGILLLHVAAGVLSVTAKTPEEIPYLVERFGCRELVATPYALHALLERYPRTDSLAQIMTVKVVAGPLSERLASTAIEAFPRARVISIYGATELGSAVFTRLVRRGESDVLGVPSPGTRARIVDYHGAMARPGTVGEIQVSQGSGESASGPERTWISTGDLGHIDKLGRIHLAGRAKEVLFLPAGRMTPAEIEDRLLEHPFIEDCGVAAIDSSDGWDTLGVCVVLKDRGKIAEAEATLNGFDPPLSRVKFVPSIPRTALGKPLRSQLWHLLMSSDP
jgi:fatty-acyl-CoA synthase